MEEYIVALYDLAENCDYGAMKEEMIRDCLVGIQDSALSQKLQLDDKLTLETAKTMTSICQKEAVHEQQQTLKGADGSTSNSSNIGAIANRKARGSHTRRKSINPAQGKTKAGEKKRTPSQGEMLLGLPPITDLHLAQNRLPPNTNNHSR